MSSSKKPKNVVVRPEPATVESSAGTPTVWLSDNFAEDWHRDAQTASQAGESVDARRQEILFAACFLESYIFEWARRNLQIEEINEFFPPTPRFEGDLRYRRGLKQKWRQVPLELFEAGKLGTKPKLDLSGLGMLIKRRNGLVHAAASRPATESQPKETEPFPTKSDLEKLAPGWALEVAVQLVRDLHQQIGSAPPDYFGEK